MASTNPIQEFDSLLSTSDFLFTVYYRGHWCPFCIAYLKSLTTLLPIITAHAGRAVIVTSEPAEHLPKTLAATGYTGAAIVDPENVLAAELARRGWLDVAISEKKGYLNGMAQPGVLVVGKGHGEKEGMGEVRVWESWKIVPSLMNLGGAKDRPDLKQIWENVEAKMKGMNTVHSKYSLQSFIGVIFKKFFG